MRPRVALLICILACLWVRACSMFLRAARTHPACVAIESSEQALTYADVERLAVAAARVLRDRGVQRGSLVATCVAEGHVAIVTQLAILLAGTRPVRAACTARHRGGPAAAVALPAGLSDRPRPWARRGICARRSDLSCRPYFALDTRLTGSEIIVDNPILVTNIPYLLSNR